jgi:pimeloyl-ACP methyl ester carboxylesterase
MLKVKHILLALAILLSAQSLIAHTPSMNTKTIVLIHGLFMNAKSWAGWKTYFEGAGYRVIVPEFPHHTGEPATLRSNIPDGLRKLDLATVVAHFEQVIRGLEEPPILIGHSIGGLVVQLLLNRGLGKCGVSIDPAPPKGVFTTKWSFLRANLPTINPLKGNSPCLPSVKWFHYAFCNVMSMEETQRIYDELVVPEARNIPRQSTKKAGKVDWDKPHAPLLIIAGEKDNIIPPSLNRKNFERYPQNGSITEFKEFPGRSHILCAQPGWEEIAGYIKTWIEK